MVDYRSLVAGRHLNEEDYATINRWHDQGFIFKARVKQDAIFDRRNLAVMLSSEAVVEAQKERTAKAGRTQIKQCDICCEIPEKFRVKNK